MIDMMIQALVSTLPVYVFFAIGFWLRAKGALRPEDDRPLLQLAMDVAYPCLIFYSIMRYMVLDTDPRIAGIEFSLQAGDGGRSGSGLARCAHPPFTYRLRITYICSYCGYAELCVLCDPYCADAFQRERGSDSGRPLYPQCRL